MPARPLALSSPARSPMPVRLLRRLVVLLLLAVPLADAPAAAAQTALAWPALSRVRVTGGRPAFDRAVAALNGREVRLTGFMLPLEPTPRQQHFLITAIPMTDCFYCIPSGPESFVEIRMAAPVAFTYERVTIAGRLTLLTTDPVGFYRITGARLVR